MTGKTLPMDTMGATVGANPLWDAQLALYASAARAGALAVDEAWSIINPKGSAPTLYIDFDPQLPHVEQLVADLTAAKDEVLSGVRSLVWQQHFLATLPFEPFPPVVLAPSMSESERYTLRW